ncbi:CU044_5270 family protein [Streptomyces sp. NPDC059783]|uniref:CU044_5270 family protein n=1 Tax=Streptomyces sp. NPDC059783 TaxID=3346944 RepID=UPI00364BD16D
MMRTPWRRQEPIDHVELSGLLPGPGDPVLPHGRMTALEEHLMNEIQQHRRQEFPESPESVESAGGMAGEPRPVRRPRRRAVLIGVAAAATMTVIAGVVGLGRLGQGPSEGDTTVQAMVPAPVVRVVPGTTRGLGSAVDRISGAAGKEKQPVPGPGQFIYIRSQVSWLSIETNMTTKKTRTWVQKLHPREVWLSPDGRKGWLIEPGNGTTSEAGMDLDSDTPPHLAAPSYDYLKALPADPDALLRKIYAETRGQGNGKYQEAFTTIGDLVREQLLTPELTSALYRAAAKIPGVVLVDEAKDAVGRSGVAIARVDEESGERTEWIFDRTSFTYLGERTVQVRPAHGIAAGTVTARTAITERSVVDTMKEVPGVDRV